MRELFLRGQKTYFALKNIFKMDYSEEKNLSRNNFPTEYLKQKSFCLLLCKPKPARVQRPDETV